MEQPDSPLLAKLDARLKEISDLVATLNREFDVLTKTRGIINEPGVADVLCSLLNLNGTQGTVRTRRSGRNKALLDFMRLNPGWHTARELADVVGCPSGRIWNCLAAYIKDGTVESHNAEHSKRDLVYRIIERQPQ